MSGNILHTWETEAKDGIAFAELVERHPELGGRRLALIGYSNTSENVFRGSMCAFHVDGDLETPVWTRQIADDQMPSGLVDEGYSSAEFGVRWADATDVFPDRDHLGSELIVVYQHSVYSPRSVCIYDLSGTLLYQIWHDGSLNSGYWMPTVRLLVFPGLNSEVRWPQRGEPDLDHAHPIVVFAVQPKLGHIVNTWTTTSPGGDPRTLAWYKCFLPAASADLFGALELRGRLPGDEAGPFIRFGAPLVRNPRASVNWLIDQTGAVVPESHVSSDKYKMLQEHGNAPDPDIFYLGELPPIVSVTE